MPEANQILFDRFEVINLPVGDELDRVVFIGKRLPTARKIDNRKPAHAQSDAGHNDGPFIVWTAVVQRPHHPLEVNLRDGTLEITFDDSDDPAHLRSPILIRDGLERSGREHRRQSRTPGGLQ